MERHRGALIDRSVEASSRAALAWSLFECVGSMNGVALESESIESEVIRGRRPEHVLIER